jgi:hypothetical protein
MRLPYDQLTPAYNTVKYENTFCSARLISRRGSVPLSREPVAHLSPFRTFYVYNNFSAHPNTPVAARPLDVDASLICGPHRPVTREPADVEPDTLRRQNPCHRLLGGGCAPGEGNGGCAPGGGGGGFAPGGGGGGFAPGGAGGGG